MSDLKDLVGIIPDDRDGKRRDNRDAGYPEAFAIGLILVFAMVIGFITWSDFL